MPSGNNEYGSKAVLPRDRFTIHILYSFFTEKPRPSGRGFFVSIPIHPSLAFSSAGIISAAQMHLYLALFFRRDYFRHPDSSLSCSSVLQGLLLPPGFILILLFSTTGIIATARIHPQLALFHCRDYFCRPDSSLSCFFFRRDYFFRSDASPACFFVPQGLLFPPGFIPSLLFCAAGITFSARIHLYLALFHRRDYCDRPNSSLSCSFVPQGLFLLRRCISILLFPTAGIISAARLHPYLALFFRRDYFRHPDSSLSCSSMLQGLLPPPGFIPSLLFSPQGLFRPFRFISILLFCAAGMISSAQMHLYLALFLRRDYFRRPDSSPACFFVPQGLFRPPGFILILLFFSTGIIATARIHPQLAFFTTGIISSARLHPYLALFFRRDYF